MQSPPNFHPTKLQACMEVETFSIVGDMVSESEKILQQMKSLVRTSGESGRPVRWTCGRRM